MKPVSAPRGCDRFNGCVTAPLAARLGLACALLLGVCACAEAPQPTVAATQATAVSTVTPLASTATAEPAIVAASPTAQVSGSANPLSPTLSSPAATQSPVAGLQADLLVADQETTAAGQSATLADAQQHAQSAINSLVGAWGRWYDVTGFGDRSDQRGVFPGERIPGPANDSPTALTPIGWGIRSYDLGDPATQQAVQIVMGNVAAWRNSPRTQYDVIAHAIDAFSAGHPLVSQLNGRAARAVAWGRLIVTTATSLDQAQRYASLGSQELGAALAAVQSLP